MIKQSKKVVTEEGEEESGEQITGLIFNKKNGIINITYENNSNGI